MAAGFKTATVRSGDVPATQTNFPSYVDLDRLGITTLAEAESVRVYADSGKTTEWAREIVSVTEMHAKVPSLTSSTEIFVDWDGVRADYAVGATYGRNAVWTGYEGVYHLNEHATILNSTGNANGTGFNTTSGDVVDGPFGKAIELLTNGDYLSLPTAALTTFTLQFLYKKNGNPTSSNAGLERASSGFIQMQITRFETNGKFGGEFRNGTSAQNFGIQSSNTDMGNNTWHWTHITVETGNQNLYNNGTNVGSTSTTHGANSLAVPFFLNRTYDVSPRYANATYDEVRIRDSVISANWITTEYNNQNAEATFWGTWTDAGGGGGGGAAQTARRGVIMMM